MRHPNIVHFLGAGTWKDGSPFLVTELLQRGSLQHVLGSSPQIEWLAKLRFALDAATGMAFLHGLGVVHRDLKSGNLLVTNNFRVKVVLCADIASEFTIKDPANLRLLLLPDCCCR